MILQMSEEHAASASSSLSASASISRAGPVA